MNTKSKRDTLAGSEDERAVSPVIGVILMVAITVILAAVIGAMMTGMIANEIGGGSAHADVTVSGDNSSEVTVTLSSASTADGIYIQTAEGYEVWETNSTGTSYTIDETTDVEINGTEDSLGNYTAPGETVSFTVVAFAENDDGDRAGENAKEKFDWLNES